MPSRAKRSDDVDPRADPARARPRRRPRPLERPVSTRLYRAAWLLVAVPALVCAFTVARPEPLPAPRLEPSFDEGAAAALARELARRYPDRTPGSDGARAAADWVSARLRDYGLEAERQAVTAELPRLGERRLLNLLAVQPGRSREAIVVMAHRDNEGRTPGANDNASGTGALLELARGARAAPPAHTLVFLSSDGGAFGAVGAARFAAEPDVLEQLVGGGASIAAVVNLDALAGRARPRLVFAGEAARSPAAALVATANESVEAETGSAPRRPHALAQLVDLAFPFTLHEQGPFVAHGTPAVTLTTGGERPPPADADTLDVFDTGRLGALGRSAQVLVTAVDESAEVARGTQSYLYAGSRFVRGWTVEFLLLAALLPFLAATLDLFARCRRRHVALGPALRSFASRLGVWLWAGAVFAVLAALGALAQGDGRPINPDSPAVREWPVAALLALLAASAAGWLVARPRLAPRREVERSEELAGHLAAMLVLGVVALVVAATNPYALIFVLPSLHAWLWLPHLSERPAASRLALYAVGLAGPFFVLASFAFRFELGVDALWYVGALAAVGYVPVALAVAALVWAAAAGQVGALAAGRYAPYPSARERPARGPIRETIRRGVLLARRRRRRALAGASEAEMRSLGD